MDNAEFLAQLEKAGITTGNTGGLLNTEQANKFIDTVVDQSGFLKSIRIERNIARARDLDNIGISSRMWHHPVEATAPADNKLKGVTTGKRTLTPVEVIVPVNVSLNYLEENLEKASVEQTILNVVTKQFGNDMVDAAFNCDTDISALDTDYEFLKVTDGIIKRLTDDTDGQVYSRASNNTDWKGSVFPNVLKALPEKHRDRDDIVLITSFQVDDEYREQLSQRNTALGDSYTTERPISYYHGRKIIAVAKIPYGFVGATTLQNLAAGLGLGTEMSIYRMLQPRSRVIEYTIRAKLDFNYVDSELIAYCE